MYKSTGHPTAARCLFHGVHRSPLGKCHCSRSLRGNSLHTQDEAQVRSDLGRQSSTSVPGSTGESPCCPSDLEDTSWCPSLRPGRKPPSAREELQGARHSELPWASPGQDVLGKALSYARIPGVSLRPPWPPLRYRAHSRWGVHTSSLAKAPFDSRSLSLEGHLQHRTLLITSLNLGYPNPARPLKSSFTHSSCRNST